MPLQPAGVPSLPTPSRKALSPPGGERPGGNQVESLPAVLRWAFFVFLFSIVFELPERTIPLETHTLTGCVLLLAALLYPRRCFHPIPAALWWFGAYLS